MKYLILVFILSSCNFFKTVTGSKTEIDKGFTSVSYKLTDELMGFWRFEEDTNLERKSSTSNYVFEISNELVPVNKSAGVHGAAVECMIDADVSSITFPLKTNLSFTIPSDGGAALAFWLYKDDNEGNRFLLDTFNAISANFILMEVFDSVSEPAIKSGLSLEIAPNLSPPVMFDNLFEFPAWYHIVINISNKNKLVEFYIDGDFFASEPMQTNDEIEIPHLGLCNIFQGATGNEFVGKIDSFGVWKRTLSSDEIHQLYSGNSGLD